MEQFLEQFISKNKSITFDKSLLDEIKCITIEHDIGKYNSFFQEKISEKLWEVILQNANENTTSKKKDNKTNTFMGRKYKRILYNFLLQNRDRLNTVNNSQDILTEILKAMPKDFLEYINYHDIKQVVMDTLTL